MSHDAQDLLPCPFCGGEASVSTYKTESLWSNNEVTYTKVSCDKCDIAFNSERGFETEAPAAWNTRAAIPPDPVLPGEVREALERIALPKVGLQGLAEDYGNDTNAYNFHAMRYFARLSQTYQRLAVNALAKLPKLTGEEV